MEVVDEDCASAMMVEIRTRNQLVGKQIRKAIEKWRSILRQDGELVSARSQPLTLVDWSSSSSLCGRRGGPGTRPGPH